MSRPSPAIVGRDRELHDISAFLDRVEDGPSALVLEGPAGIGKTTLWIAGVRAAIERGHRVLTTRAAESEARLSYAALGDLLGTVSDAAFAGMPAPLRRALDAALMRSDGPDGAPDQRAVSLATAHVLRNLAADAPLVLAVDDVQWLDQPSARVLSFALRRFSDDRIGALVSLRVGAGFRRGPSRAGPCGPADDPPRRWARCSRSRWDGSCATGREPRFRIRSCVRLHTDYRRQPAVRPRDGARRGPRWRPRPAGRRVVGARGPAEPALGAAGRRPVSGASPAPGHRGDVAADMGPRHRDRRIGARDARRAPTRRGSRRHRARRRPRALQPPAARLHDVRQRVAWRSGGRCTAGSRR